MGLGGEYIIGGGGPTTVRPGAGKALAAAASGSHEAHIHKMDQHQAVQVLQAELLTGLHSCQAARMTEFPNNLYMYVYIYMYI